VFTFNINNDRLSILKTSLQPELGIFLQADTEFWFNNMRKHQGICHDCKKSILYKRNKRCRKCHYKFSYGHGMEGTRFYIVWTGIKTRCNNPNVSCYSRYGGRGIKVLWKNFEEFRDDMYKSYLEHVKEFGEKQTQIDRKNNDGNYEKCNCRWATFSEQAQNKRNNKMITFNGKTLCLAEWTEKLGIKYQLTHERINRYKWPVEKAFTTLVGVKEN